MTPSLGAQDYSSVYVNDGLNGARDEDFGEFATDMGGHVPFVAFSTPGNYWFDNWTLPSQPEAAIRADFHDLEALNSLLAANGVPLPSLPLPVHGTLLVYDDTQKPWWDTSKKILLWRYEINGAEVEFIFVAPTLQPPPVTEIVIEHLQSHTGVYVPFPLAGKPLFLQPIQDWHFRAGTPILDPIEQAAEQGHLIVRISENWGEEFWIALQRSQEAEWFARNEFLPNIAGVNPAQIGRAVLVGFSHGAWTAGGLGLLQSKIYAGSLTSFGRHLSFNSPVGPWMRLATHIASGPASIFFFNPDSDVVVNELHALVDMLGCRFDNPQQGPSFSVQPWDVDAFSVFARDGDLQTRISGPIGSEDNLNNWHWEDSTTIGPTYMKAEIFQFTAHELYAEQHKTHNKVSHVDGTEYDTHMGAANPAANNNPLVPATPPPHPPYPDCYDHTLAHWPDALPEPNVPFLTELDLVPGTDATWIGQGTMVGYGHTMRVMDADGDGEPELIFGNFDGHIHVMEQDLELLVDEWRSDFLGHSLYAVADTNGGLPMYFANGAGQIYKFHRPGGYQVDLLNPTGTAALYDGQTHRVYLGDFDSQGPGDELLALNLFNDWVLLQESNASQIGSRWWRRNRIHGPGQGQVVPDVPFMDFTDGDDLLMPAYDGSVWRVSLDGLGRLQVEPVPGFDFLNRALYRLETFEIDGNPYAFVFGTNDIDGGKVTLIDLQTGTVEFDDSIGVAIVSSLSFAWIQQPTSTTPGTFAVGAGRTVYRFDIDVTGCSGSGSYDFDFLDQGSEKQQTPTLSIAFLPTGGNGRLAVGTEAGRIFLLDAATLLPTRTSADIDASGNTLDYWHANHTFARAAAADVDQAPPADTGTVYIGDYFKQWNHTAAKDFRMAQLSVDLNTTPEVQFTEIVDQVHHVADRPEEAMRTRTLFYRDLDGSGAPEAYPLSESGVAYVDPSGDLRQFSNVTHDPDLVSDLLKGVYNPKGKGIGQLGGFVFEQLDPTGDIYGAGQQAVVLDDFYALRDPLGRYAEHSDPTKKLWWRKIVKGENKTWGGQIATGFQSTWGYYEASSSMTTAMMTPPGGSTPVLHVVTGTIGGYVFAIEPPVDPPILSATSVDASLSYYSDDLGWYAVGLDAGNLDADADEEIVVGVWVDAGSFDDWVLDDATKNRGKVYILDPQPGAGTGTQFFTTTELTGWDGIDPATGLSSGVFGVKIDDVNDDGQAEIWAGDANGALHLFEFVGGQWTRIYQSEDLAPYAGWWNGIFPIKDGAGGTGKTVGLILRTTGYWMGFHVDPSQLWGP